MAARLGELQLQVMEAVWRRGEATVAEVHRNLAAERKLAYTTILTTMRSLERRGMLTHRSAGKAYVYCPTLSRQQYAEQRVGKLVEDLFHGRQERLLCHLLGAPRITRKELEQIRRLVGGHGEAKE